MAAHLVGSLGLTAVTLFEHLVLQTRRQSDHTLLGSIGLEIGFTLGLVLLEALGSSGTLLLLLLVKEIAHDGLRLRVREFHLTTCKHVLDSLCKIIDIQVFGSHVGELAAYAET